MSVDTSRNCTVTTYILSSSESAHTETYVTTSPSEPVLGDEKKSVPLYSHVIYNMLGASLGIPFSTR